MGDMEETDIQERQGSEIVDTYLSRGKEGNKTSY